MGLDVFEAAYGKASEAEVLFDEGEDGFDEVAAFGEVGFQFWVVLSLALAGDGFVV